MQDSTFLHDGDPLECVDVIRVNREEIHQVIHSFVPVAVVFGEFLKVGADAFFLGRRLFQ